MSVKDLFNLTGVDIDTPGDDQVILSFHHVHVSVFIQPSQVTRMEPSVLELLCGLFRHLPVPYHHGFTPAYDLAHLADRDVMIILVHDSYLVVDDRLSTRSEPCESLLRPIQNMVFRLKHCGEGAALRLTVEL